MAFRRSGCDMEATGLLDTPLSELDVFDAGDWPGIGLGSLLLIDKAIEDAVGLVYRRLGLQTCLGECDLVGYQRAELIESRRERGCQVACHRIGIEPSQCVENLVLQTVR